MEKSFGLTYPPHGISGEMGTVFLPADSGLDEIKHKIAEIQGEEQAESPQTLNRKYLQPKKTPLRPKSMPGRWMGIITQFPKKSNHKTFCPGIRRGVRRTPLSVDPDLQIKPRVDVDPL
eukprot:NODE_282_length_1018_cov_1.534078_g279_i0.p1 GENE.NODE_282_length_1018_cov_1.534078_g279_i0~~NODE_282_length_1018_cov_1.534078_g279_i0.p1  ORF type:complete len:119 (-),score=9.10 NODE_282_length_1018_cov_1.534078_g279_i0:163-519(-)